MAQENIALPQLMQETCFNLADRIAMSGDSSVTIEPLHKAFHDTVMNYSHYDAILQKVLRGPAQGRNKRKSYDFKDDIQADIYHLFLKSICVDPPVLSMNITDIRTDKGLMVPTVSGTLSNYVRFKR